jgi:hypothetical protein
MEWIRREWDVHALPMRLVKEYLQELGGQIIAEDQVTGPGWVVKLQKVEDFQLGSIRLGCLHLELEADPETMATFLPALERKLQRGGG